MTLAKKLRKKSFNTEKTARSITEITKILEEMEHTPEGKKKLDMLLSDESRAQPKKAGEKARTKEGKQ